MSENLKLLIVAAAPTIAVVVSHFLHRRFDGRAHSKIDDQLTILLNGKKLKELTGGK